MKGKKIKDLNFPETFGLVVEGLKNYAMTGNADIGNRGTALRYGENGDDLIIDTCHAPDTGYWETGIAYINCNNGDWIIVEQYEDEPQALLGHEKWIKLMTNEELPKKLWDIYFEKYYKMEGVKNE